MLIFFALNFIFITYIQSDPIQKGDLVFKDSINLSKNKDFINITNYKSVDNINTSILTEEIDKSKEKFLSELPIDKLKKLNSTIVEYSLYGFLEELPIISLEGKSKKNRALQFKEFVCNGPESCNNHGNCTLDKKNCTCQKEYATIANQTNPNEIIMCNYERKTQLRAFLYELFLGFGAGHFYTERFTHAGLKLGAFIFGIFIICLFPITAKCLSEKLESDCLVLTVSCFYYLCSVGLAFWFIYDLVQFGMNNYKDGNQIELLSWAKNAQ